MTQPPKDKTLTFADKLSIIFIASIVLLVMLAGIVGLIRNGWDVMSNEAPGILVALFLIGMLVYIGIASHMKKKGNTRIAATMYVLLVFMFLFVFVGQFSMCSTNLSEDGDRPYRY